MFKLLLPYDRRDTLSFLIMKICLIFYLEDFSKLSTLFRRVRMRGNETLSKHNYAKTRHLHKVFRSRQEGRGGGA